MKKLFILFALTAGLFACTGSNDVEVGNKTTMEVDLVYDAGKVLKGEMITAKFNVRNTGNYPLVIADVKGSCSCTVAEFPEDPILPGESGEIMAHVNTDQTGAGVLNKAVRIVANTEPLSVTQLIIKANVMNK